MSLHNRTNQYRTATQTITTACALLLLLTGCGPTDSLIEPLPTGDASMTPDEAKHDLWDRLDAAEVVLGGTWEKTQTEVANDCDGGYYYDSIRRRVESVSDPDLPTDALAKFWDTPDYTVTEASFDPDHRSLIATATNGTTMAYAVGETVAGKIEIFAEGPCIPGDYRKVSDEDFRRYKESHPSEFPTP